MNFCLFLSRPACLLSSDGKLAALVSKKYFVTEGKKRLDICSTVLVQSEDHQTDQTITRITLRSRKTTVVLSCLSSEVMTSSVRWEVNCNCVNKPFFFFLFVFSLVHIAESGVGSHSDPWIFICTEKCAL